MIKHPDPLFYGLLVLINATRIGRARERSIAINLVEGKMLCSTTEELEPYRI